MSKVDKRVVQMVFDNEQFEKNIAKSQKSLENIDKQVSSMGDSLKPDSISNAVSKGMSNAETIISAKAELFRGIMLKIGGEIGSFFTKTIGDAQRAINSLTFDQVNAGFSKYEEKLSSVQTIMNATGKSIEFVEEQMEKLNWYTDETSANFTDMTNNIGKFTSAGIELEEASQAMMGISNWAYLSGANLQQASAAMYNFSQAMGAGAMQSQDWKSIENANMATASFKETVILTAKELYKSGQIAEDVIDKYGVTVENFRSTLKDKWFDSTIMMEATKVYGQYSNYVKEIQDNGTKVISQSIKDAYKKANDEDISFSLASGVVDYLDWVQENYTQEMTELINKYGADSKELKQLTSDLGISIEQALDMTKVTQNLKGENVTGYFYNMSKSAFLAAQEYKTFADVISATADAVSTKWMNIFQIIFGNYEEAKSIWSEFGDLFYDIFAQPIDNLLTIIEAWQRFHGQVLLFGTETSSVFTNLRDVFYSIKNALETGFMDVLKETFPELSSLRQMGMQLAYLTYKINLACEQLKENIGGLTEDGDRINAVISVVSKVTGKELPHALTLADKIRSATRGVLKILRAVGRVVTSLGKGIVRIIKAILPSFDTILDLFVKVDENGDVLEEKSIQIAKTIETVCKIIAALITKFKQAVMDGSIVEYLTALGKFLLGSALQFITGFFKQAGEETTGFASTLQKAGNSVLGVLQNIANFIFSKLTDAYNKFMSTGFGQALARLFAQLPTLFKNIGSLIVNAMTNIINLFAMGAEMVNRFFASFKDTSFGTNASGTGLGILGMLFILLQSIIMAVMEGKAMTIMDSINEAIEGLSDTLETFQASIKADILKKIGMAILEIAIAAMLLASIEPTKLKVTLLILGGTLVALLGSMAIISSISASKVGASGLAGMMKQLTSVAMSMLILSAVVLKFSKMDPEELVLGLIGLAGVFAEVVFLIGGLRVTTAAFSAQNATSYKRQIDGMTSIMKSMIIMIIAINMLRPSIKALGKLPRKELTQGISAMMFLAIYIVAIMGCIAMMANPRRTGNILSTRVDELFYKNIVAIATTLGIVAVAIGLLVISLVALSSIPGILLLKGYLAMSFLLKWVGKLFNLTTKIMGNLSQTANMILSGNSIIQVALALIMITVAVNMLLIPLEVMAYTPLPMLIQGGVATILLMSWMVIFLGGLKDIISGRSIFGGTGTSSFLRIDKWAEDIIFISLALIAVAAAVMMLIVPVKQFGEMKLSALAKGFGSIFVAMLLAMGVMSALMLVSAYIKTAASFNATVLAASTAFLLLAAGVTVIGNAIKMFGEMDDTVYETGSTRMLGLVYWFAILAGVFALISKVASFAARNISGVSNVAKNVFFIGAGLLMFAAALMLLLVPLDILANIKDPNIYIQGIGRLAQLMLVLAIFIGLLMAFYGIMTKVNGGPTVLNETNEIQRNGFLFNKKTSKDKAVTFGKDMADFGKALLLVVGAITLLILPLTVLGNLDTDVYIQGMAGLGIIMALLAALIGVIGYTFKSSTTGQIWSMVGLMAAVGILIFALLEMVKKTGEYITETKKGETDRWKSFLIGVLGVFGVLAGVILGVKFLAMTTGKPGELLAAAGSLAIVAASIIGIAFAIKLIADAAQNNKNAVEQATGFIALVMVLAGVYIGLLNYFLNPSDLITAAATFAIMAAGIVAIAGALAIVATLDPTWDNAFQIIAIMAALFIAIGVIGKLVPWYNLMGIAAAMLIMSGAFVLVTVGLLGISSAIIILAKAAEQSKEGWAVIEKGIAALLVVTVVLGIMIALLGALGVALPGSAVMALLFAAAIFLIAAAFFLVIQAIIDLSERWDIIKTCLDDLSDWLELHKDEWSTIIDDFVLLIKDSMITGIKEALAQTSTLVNGAMGILEQGWTQYWENVGAERHQAEAENKRLESLAKETYDELGNTYLKSVREGRRARGLTVGQDMVSMRAAENRQILLEEYGEALKDFVLSHNAWNSARADELRDLIYNSFHGAKANEFTDEEIKEMYIAAGGTYIDEYGNRENLKTRQQQAALDAENARSLAYKQSINQQLAYEEEERKKAATNAQMQNAQNEYSRSKQSDYYGGLITAQNAEYFDKLEDVGLGANIAGDGTIIGETADNVDELNTRLEILRKNAQNDPSYKGATSAEAEAAMIKWGGKTGVTAGANAGNAFGDTFWSVIANLFNGNAGSVAWAAGLKDVADDISGAFGNGLNDLKTQFNSWLEKAGIDFNFGEGVDQFFSGIGVDTNSKMYQNLKKNLSWDHLSTTAQDTISKWQQYMVEGNDPITAFTKAVDFNFDTTAWFNADTLKEVTDFLGISDLMTDEEGNSYFEGWEDFTKMFEGDENPLSKVIEDAAKTFNLEDILSGDTSGIDIKMPEVGALPSMDLSDLYSKYGYGTDDFKDLGNLDGTAYMDGLSNSMLNNSDFANATDDIKSQLSSAYGDSKKNEEIVTRVINGQYIDAPKVLDLVQANEESIKHLKERRLATRQNPYDPLKNMASVIEKGYNLIEDYATPGAYWRREEGSDFWYKVGRNGNLFTDENGNMITIANKEMEANIELWKTLRKQDEEKSKTKALEKQNRKDFIESLYTKRFDRELLGKSFINMKDANGKDLYGYQLDDGKIVVSNAKGVLSKSQNGKNVMYDPTTGKYVEVENKSIYPFITSKDFNGKQYYGRQMAPNKVVLTNSKGVPLTTDDGRLRFYDPVSQKYYEEITSEMANQSASQNTTADGIMMMANATQNAQNSQPSTSAVTNTATEQAKNKAAQNGYYVDPNGNVYGTKAQAQTGTSAQSAAQSAATSLDYLRSINGYSFYMYQMMQNMQMQMASIDQNTGIIRDNVTEIKTQPKPAVLGEDQVRKVANFTNLALGKAASLTRRGVTS